MRSIELEEVKRIQLDILRHIHVFCAEHGIRYSLAFGTLLGAIRHQGYIPWDDDIDIMMPRADYEKFIHIFSDEKYVLGDHSLDPNYVDVFAKIHDPNIILVDHRDTQQTYGAFVDIFPIDDMPDDIKEQNKLLRKKSFWNIAYNYKIMHASSKRVWYKNVVILIAHLLLLPLTLDYLIKKVQSLSMQYYGCNSTKKGVIIHATNRMLRIYDSALFEEYKEVPFECYNFNTVRDADAYLTLTYGDYMKLPPESARVPKHHYKYFSKELL